MLAYMVPPRRCKTVHRSSMVRASEMSAKCFGRSFSSPFRPIISFSHASTHSAPSGCEGQATRTQPLSRRVGSRSSSAAAASRASSSKFSSFQTKLRRASLSHHVAPKYSRAWQKASSAAWSGSRRKGGSRASRCKKSKSGGVAFSRTMTPPRDGQPCRVMVS